MYQRVLAAWESLQLFSSMTLMQFETHFPALDVTTVIGLHEQSGKLIYITLLDVYTGIDRNLHEYWNVKFAQYCST